MSEIKGYQVKLYVKFKYQESMVQLPIQCPPSDYKSKEIKAFRWVFEANQPQAKNNFLPALIIKPSRRLSRDTPADRCKGYALSLFDTKENAEKRYSRLIKDRPALRKSLGTHLAEGLIDSTDGVSSKVDDNGHFSLHEFVDSDLAKKFQIVSAL